MLAAAPTGSGKTAAFALPVLQHVLARAASHPRRPRALVLVPTRELAIQVGAVMRSVAQALPVRVVVSVVFGGVSINPQMMGLRGGADVVVSTPGRLLDLVEHRALHLDNVHLLVLDEADRLLDSGFAEELQRVLDLLPSGRQNLLFSASFTPAVQKLAQGLLNQPTRIDIPALEESRPDIRQRAIAVDDQRRTQLLRHLLATHGWDRALVFVATQYAAEHVAEKLYRAGIYATPFHGKLSQGARQQILQEFKDQRWQVLVTTDLASRGIDIVQLPAVIQYDLPRSAVDYVHRIGRTGRAGESGEAVSFVTPAAQAHWRLITKRQGLSVPVEVCAGFEPTQTPPPGTAAGITDGNGGIKGRRPSKKDKLRAQAQQNAAATNT